VKNIGAANVVSPFVVGWSTDCPVSLNPDSSYTNAAKQWIVPQLAAGTTATLSYTYTPIRGGRFTQTATADLNNDINEQDNNYYYYTYEYNNTMQSYFNVLSPDLIVDRINFQGDLLTNSPVTVSVVIKNQGNGAVTYPFLTSWASTDCPTGVKADGTYTYPGSDWTTETLGAGESTTLQYTFIPIRAGAFSSYATADVNNSVHEETHDPTNWYGFSNACEGNNSLNGTMSIDGPDLVIQSVTLTPTTLKANSLITVTVVVKNQGKAPVSTPFVTSWWSDDCPVGLKADGSRIFASKEWTINSLAASATTTLTTTITPIQGGTFRYWACTDYSLSTASTCIHEEVYQQYYVDDKGYGHSAGWLYDNENNNYANQGKLSSFIVVGPDLVVQSVSFDSNSIKSNAPATITVIIKNQGSAPVNSAFITRWESYNLPVGVDANGYLTMASNEWTTPSLAEGATKALTYTFTPIRGGTFSYRLSIDTTNSVDESVYNPAYYDANNQYHYATNDQTNEQNNSYPIDGSFSQLQVDSPDLVIDSVSFGAKPLGTNQAATVTVVIKNQGAAPTSGSFTTYWSSNCQIAGNQYAAKEWSTPPLDAGATTTLTYTFTPVSYGNYTYTASVDTKNDVHEETNDINSSGNWGQSYKYANENNNSSEGVKYFVLIPEI